MFQRVKRFPNFCLHKGNALEKLVLKKCLYTSLIFVFSIFIYVVATTNWFK